MTAYEIAEGAGQSDELMALTERKERERRGRRGRGGGRRYDRRPPQDGPRSHDGPRPQASEGGGGESKAAPSAPAEPAAPKTESSSAEGSE